MSKSTHASHRERGLSWWLPFPRVRSSRICSSGLGYFLVALFIGSMINALWMYLAGIVTRLRDMDFVTAFKVTFLSKLTLAMMAVIMAAFVFNLMLVEGGGGRQDFVFHVRTI